jgi:hypothetical protein
MKLPQPGKFDSVVSIRTTRRDNLAKRNWEQKGFPSFASVDPSAIGYEIAWSAPKFDTFSD